MLLVEEIDDWVKDVAETEEADVNFPIVADDTAEISKLVSYIEFDCFRDLISILSLSLVWYRQMR